MKSGMTPEPGDIVLIPFPFSDLSSSKKRPVLVLTPPDRFGDFIAAGITSVAQQDNAVTLDPSCLVNGSLPRKSWVRTDKLFTLSTDSVAKSFGTLKSEVFHATRQSICQDLGCNGG
jgi:mRNA interferase MazF